MQPADTPRVDAFLHKWLGSEGNERANYQGFFLDLYAALNVEAPPPKGIVLNSALRLRLPLRTVAIAPLNFKLAYRMPKFLAIFETSFS